MIIKIIKWGKLAWRLAPFELARFPLLQEGQVRARYLAAILTTSGGEALIIVNYYSVYLGIVS
jgi:hypothetical protein